MILREGGLLSAVSQTTHEGAESRTIWAVAEILSHFCPAMLSRLEAG